MDFSMTEDKNLLAASYDWWSHNGSIKPMQLKIALGSGKEPAVIQSIIDRAVSEERAAIVAWLRENSTPHNDIDEWADEIEAGVHLK